MGLIKITTSLQNNFKGIGRQATDREKIFAKSASDKGLLSKISKNS